MIAPRPDFHALMSRRIGFATCANPQNSRERLLVNVKNNLGARAATLRYGLKTDSAGSRLSWLGPANPLTEQLSLPSPAAVPSSTAPAKSSSPSSATDRSRPRRSGKRRRDLISRCGR